MKEILKKSAAEQFEAIKNKEVKAVELLDATYERIDEVESKVESFNCLTKDIAYETAKKVDEKVANGEELPLLVSNFSAALVLLYLVASNALIIFSRSSSSLDAGFIATL